MSAKTSNDLTDVEVDADDPEMVRRFGFMRNLYRGYMIQPQSLNRGVSFVVRDVSDQSNENVSSAANWIKRSLNIQKFS